MTGSTASQQSDHEQILIYGKEADFYRSGMNDPTGMTAKVFDTMIEPLEEREFYDMQSTQAGDKKLIDLIALPGRRPPRIFC